LPTLAVPKQSEVTSTFISTQEPFPGGAAAAAPNAAPGFAAHIKAVSDAMDGVWTAAQQRINSAFARVRVARVLPASKIVSPSNQPIQQSMNRQSEAA
jgi:hypothetical protein